MADTQITILGMSGAGKTCYLLGLYYKMGAGLKGYTITSDEDTDVQLRNRYARLCDVTLDKGKRFPAGTDNISRYEFDLQYGYNTIMTFDWIDYPGGMLSQKSDGNLEEYEDIKKSINNSSSLFICVDGELLRGNDIDEKIENVRDNCSNVINTFFTEYFKNKNELPPTAIILTKYDTCRDDTTEEEVCEIIKEAFSPLFVEDNIIEKIVTIIPVSIGLNIMDNDGNGKLKPLNVHLPIFMAIYFALIKKIQVHMKKQENNDNSIDFFKGVKITEEVKWFFKNEKLIEKLTKDIKKAENYKNELNSLLEILLNNKDKLIKELSKIKYVYINGKERSFEDII